MLQKQPINIPFNSGINTKTDPKQIPTGQFLSLVNTVFNNDGLFQKRNGYGQLASLPTTKSSYVTTFNGDLTAIGTELDAFSLPSEMWVNKGFIQPASLSVKPVIRNNSNQSQVDTAISPNGFVCTTYTDNVNVAGTLTPFYKYVITDQATGQNIVAPTNIPVTSGAVNGTSRVFQLGNYFIILYTNTIGGTDHLTYVAINIYSPTSVTVPSDIDSSYVSTPGLSFDATVSGTALYIAYNTTSGGQSIKVKSLTAQLVLSVAHVFAGRKATLMSVTSDQSGNTPVIWASFWDSVSTDGYVLAIDSNLNTILAPTLDIPTVPGVLNITCAAQNGSVTTYFELAHNYSYDAAIPTHFIDKVSVTQAGAVGSTSVLDRSVGLASRAVVLNGMEYLLTVYQSLYQPTYFLLDSSGRVIAKFAYQNGGGYYTHGLPGVAITGSTLSIGYLFKDLIAAVNKNTNVPAGTQVNGIYSQLGVNLVAITIGAVLTSAETGSNLNISGGFVWNYDGYSVTEQNFFVYPDSVEVTTSGAGGLITAQEYFYQVTYEWTDNQGNAFRSAPSIPVSITTAGATSSNTINVPTLRLTYKTQNPVKIVIYRWSAAQQTYYQVTSLTLPQLNDTTIDSIAYVDTLSDASILGNNIIYTNGGVVEDVSPPATSSVFLFDDRLFLIDAEDPNLLWFSKQVIEATPVEMSDLFTIFVSPTASAQGSAGPLLCGAPLDDKLILFKKDAIYYINGTGPDNTGANNQYSAPVFITATVGCANQASIVFIPSGLMFQSDKGIWLLGRDLQTQYIGAPVEKFNSFLVQSAVNIPGTNQVRFTLSSGITLMYDYYYNRWTTFSGVPAVSSTLYQSLHTFINSFGKVFQETPGKYLDGSTPVTMSFQTGWLNLAGLQGYERAYVIYLLGEYLSPHRLQVSVAYDYSLYPSQQSIINPTNFAGVYGQDPIYGLQTPFGGPPSLENWRIELARQRCMAFQLSVQEIFDPNLGAPAGAGLTLSGIHCKVGIKRGTRPLGPESAVG